MTRRKTASFHSYSYFIIFATISILFYVLDRFGFLFIVRYPLEAVLIPPQSVIVNFRLSARENLSLIFSQDVKNKVFEYEKLSGEVDVLQAKIDLLTIENKRLKDLLEAPYPVTWDFISAKVLGGERYMVIDRGLRDGVKPGMVVITSSALVGRVFSVHEKTSQVLYLWDPESKVSAKTDKGTRGLLVGQFGNRVEFTRVLQKDSLNELDTVYTTGEESEFPADLVIGKIDSVAAQEEEVYKLGVVALTADYAKLDYVFVISSY